MSDLRERMAETLFNAGRGDRGPEYGAVPWRDLSGKHRAGWLRLADAILTLPELTPLRDGEPLYRECSACQGFGWTTNPEAPSHTCVTCGGEGYIALTERGSSDVG